MLVVLPRMSLSVYDCSVPPFDDAQEQAVFTSLLNGLYPRSDLLQRWYRQATATQRAAPG